MPHTQDSLIRVASLELARNWMRAQRGASVLSEADWRAFEPGHLARYLMLDRSMVERLLEQPWAELAHGDPAQGLIEVRVLAPPDHPRPGRLESPSCPACGAIADRVLERHLVWNAIDARLDGAWGGPGDTETERTSLARDVAGLVRVRCRESHEWSTRLVYETGEVDPDGDDPHYALECFECGRAELYITSLVVHGPIALGPMGFNLEGEHPTSEEIVRCRHCGHEEALSEHVLHED